MILLLLLIGSEITVTAVSDHRGPGMQPSEPAVAISRADPDRVVVGAIPNRVFLSTDGGKTWRADRMKSVYGVWGDPSIVSDGEGNFFYFHLANPRRGLSKTSKLERIVCQRSRDGGETWEPGGSFGFRKPRDQDKEWAYVDSETGALYVTWTEFDVYGSRNPDHRSRILFSTSSDGAESWSKAVVISDREGTCRDDDQTAEGAVPTATPDGTIHVAWALDEEIFYDRSRDGGKTWSTDRVIARQPGGWDFRVAGLYRANGLPVLISDRSNGPERGTLYLVWTDQRNGRGDTDVWLKTSRDGGENWSEEPLRVNRDGVGRDQFYAWPAIDDTTGFLGVLFYDRRRHRSEMTDVVLAWSEDGGRSFSEWRLSARPFLPRRKVFFGDYINLDLYAGRLAAVWTRMDEGRTSIWAASGSLDALNSLQPADAL